MVGYAYVLTHESPAANNLRRSIILAQKDPFDSYLMSSADYIVSYKAKLAVASCT